MMVLQIYITDDEMKSFFEANGFEVTEREFQRWEKVTHSRHEMVSRMQLAVIWNGKPVEARGLLERLSAKRLKRYLMPQSLEAKRSIETELKTLLK